jgi:beta-xylosidase
VPGSQPVWRKGIGLAISEDGFNFQKFGREPIARTRADEQASCSDLFYRDGQWHMMTCQARVGYKDGKGFACCLQVSDDPTEFESPAERVFEPGSPGSWDARAIASPVFYYEPEDGYYYMLYGGCDKHWDYPSAFGLARSRDLRHWERHPENPLIFRGEPGQWDEGAIFMTELIRVNGTYYAYYEGRSAGRDRNEEYSPGATKAIGLMTLKGKLWP